MGSADLQGDWPLVGRAEELAELVTVVEGGVSHPERPGGAVVVAPAGVGKTRLLQEVRRCAEERAVPTVTAIATRAAAQIPYAALAHLAPHLPASGEIDRAVWFHEFARNLPEAPGSRPVLLVDDGQWLDAGSAALILHLALTGAATVVVAARRDEPVPDPITALWRDGLALRIDMQPFSRLETERLIDTVLDGEVSRRTTRRLAEVSQGNILFARELVIGAVAAQSLQKQDGVWRWDEELVLAPRLVDAVAQRLQGLDEEQRRALALLALGEPMPLPAVDRIVSPRTAARLEAAGLVRVEGIGPDAVCRPAHPLYGEVLLSQVGRVERRHMVRALADVFDAIPDPTERSVVQIAAWRLEAGGEVSPELLTDAAVFANRAFDHHLAERLAKAALAAGAGPRVVLEMVTAYQGQHRVEEAERALTGAEPDILASDDMDLHQAYLERCDRVLYLSLGRREAMHAVLRRFRSAHEGLTGEHFGQARELADVYQAKLLLDEGRLHEVLSLTEPVLADPEAGLLPLARALEPTGEALVYLGRTHSARKVIARMRELASTAPDQVGELGAHGALQEIMCVVHGGRVVEALTVLRDMHERTLGSRDLYVRTLVTHVLAATHLQQGSVRTARTLLLDAAAGFREHSASGSMAWALVMASQAASLLGDVTSARQSWESALAARPPCRIARMEADFIVARALLLMAEGNVTGAQKVALEGASEVGDLALHRAGLLHLAARLGASSRKVLDGLSACADGVECELPALQRDHVRALAERDACGLESVAGRFADLGLWLVAAEAAASASRCHADAGRRGASARTARRAEELSERCQGATTPALRHLTERPRLSPREAEVARLAAGGLSNAQIADRLVLSVRTVESHLYNVFAKTGVEQRDSLTDVLEL